MYVCILRIKCILSQFKMADIYSYRIYTKFSQITRQFGTRFECRLISNYEKKIKNHKNNTTFIFLRACIKYVRTIWFLTHLHQQKFCKHKSSVQIMAYLQRALQNYYQHQHIETCTKFTNVHFFPLKTCTLVPWYKQKKTSALIGLKNKLIIRKTKTSVGFKSRIYKMSLNRHGYGL